MASFWQGATDLARAILDRYPMRAQYPSLQDPGVMTEVTVNARGVGGPGDPSSIPVHRMWETQPHLRTVVDFRARNIAQLGLHLYKRMPDGGRERVRTSPAARALGRPNEEMTTFDLVYDLVATKSLYECVYWFVFPDTQGMVRIFPFPDSKVTEVRKDGRVDRYQVVGPDGKLRVDISPEFVVPFKGWRPAASGSNASPVETLREVLSEQYHSRNHRTQLWRRNGRVGTYITRPVDAPPWTPEDRKRFYSMFEAFTGNGPRAGGTPLIEDGMDLKSHKFTSADEQWAESVQLSLRTVAQVYQVSPVMVGDVEGTSWSNVREFNRQLYTNSLGPDIQSIEDRMNTFVLPMLGAAEDEYVEFNVESQLRGSFEEQAAVISTSVGGPWMTRSEGRERFNLPHLDDADELIVPLNVTEGGQSSPQDGGDGEPDPFDQAAVNDVLAKTESRQIQAYKSSGVWDEARWDRELAKDLARAGIPRDSPLSKALVRSHCHRVYQSLQED